MVTVTEESQVELREGGPVGARGTGSGRSGYLDRVDHLVYAAPELEAGIARAESLLGVRAVPGGRHPAWGTRNALLALGETAYLEVIAPDPELPAPDGPRPFRVDEVEEPRLVTWAAKAEEPERAAARLEAAELAVAGGAGKGSESIHLGPVAEGSRRRPDGTELSWRLTDPAAERAGGVVPFLIRWGDAPHPAADAPAGCALRGLRARHPDPDRVREALLLLELDLPVEAGPVPSLVARIAAPGGAVELR